jgi:protein TonB
MRNAIKEPLRHRGLFMRIGFVAALVLVILAFQWKTAYEVAAPNRDRLLTDEVMMEPIRTRHDKKEMPDAEEVAKVAAPEQKSHEIRIVPETTEEAESPEPDFNFDQPVEIPPLPDPPVDDEPFEPLYLPSEMPSFPGGKQAAIQFIADRLRYPQYEHQIGLEGIVYVQFVVDREGNITDIEILRSPSEGFAKEAIRVLQLMPKWNPGRNNGRFVPVYYTLPIRFKLDRHCAEVFLNSVTNSHKPLSVC